MKTLLCQINTTPGDFAGNTDKIKKGIEIGFRDGADLIVFPELSIPGYLMRDMVYDSDFVEQNLRRIEEIRSFYDVCANSTSGKKEPVVVFGYVDRNHSGVGKPFRNMAIAIQGGVTIGTYAKQLLPFYDVFDEGRYFEPGHELCVIKILGRKWGICICEDVWNDKGADDYQYEDNPLQQYRNLNIHNIISLNSSPWVDGKVKVRVKMIQESSYKGTIIYVNQIGGQDELVFDGNSFIAHRGELRYITEQAFLQGETDETVYIMHDLEEERPALEFVGMPNPSRIESIHAALRIGLSDYIKKSGFKSIVFGSSGGIDSAVVAALACEVLGPENVHGIRMPSRWSSSGSKDDALELHKNLGCNDYIVPIEHQSWIDSIIGDLSKGSQERINDIGHREYNNVADENIQARMRGTILMYYSNAFGSLLLTTGNKTELAVGYCTLYGDMNGGFAPINGLYKMDVYALAKHINAKAGKEVIPEAIISKAPSAELSPGQTDEASLLPYPILDSIVKLCVEHQVTSFKVFKLWAENMSDYYSLRTWADIPSSEKEYNRMIRLIKNSEFKRRQAAPGIKVNRVDFGTGRRYPIVKR